MGVETGAATDREQRILNEVRGWAEITLGAHRFGGTRFQLEKGEIGHLHPGGRLDVPFPKPVRDQLVASGRAEPHQYLPTSGWVSIRIRSEADVARALELLRLAYDLRLEDRTRRKRDRALDEALEGTFPASDPPAVGPP